MNLTHSESIKEIATALAKAQSLIEGASKDSANPFFKSSYADLSSVWAAVRKPLTANGIAVIQSPHADGLRVSVDTLLTHISGEWMRGTVSVSAKEDSPQAVGSCITYLRRYALQSFAGVAPEDDDGEAAEGRKGGKAAPKTAPKTPDGFAGWLMDMESTVDNGFDALQSAWKASKNEYRKHLADTDQAKWESMKAAAARAI